MTDPETQPETFRLVADLIGLITDAPRCKRRMADLQKAEQRAAAATAKLVADRAAHDELIRKETAEIAEQRAALSTRDASLRIRENVLRERETAEDKERVERIYARRGSDLSGSITREEEFPDDHRDTRVPAAPHEMRPRNVGRF